MHDVAVSEQVTKDTVTFLLRHRSQSWTWNYWQRSVLISSTTPYPDDLDDTANALIAVQLYSPKLVSGAALGHIAHSLVTAEQQRGGPYRTWLVPAGTKNWDDVDVAVNANIGMLLAMQNVRLPKLNRYIAQQIRARKLNSPYYVGEIPVIYFLSEWYKGAGTAYLKKIVLQEISNPKKHNALTLSLLITAAANLGVSNKALKSAVAQLVSLHEVDHWPAEALYLDPAVQGKPQYAGSAALTTAFALQALQKTERHRKAVYQTVKNVPPNTTLHQAKVFSENLPSGLQHVYQQYLMVIEAADAGNQITAMANLCATAYNVTLPAIIKTHLNLASLNGWMAYTIYDDFLDDEGKPQELGAANVALRQTLYHFEQALPNQPSFSQLVSHTLILVDEANTWEVTHARAKLSDGLHHVTLPNFEAYAQLAHKSYGHMLVACAVAIYAGHTVHSTAMEHLQKFFHHFLIAKQLNDDAHDWREDLEHGHLSAVVTMLLAHESSPYKLDTTQLASDFWQHTISQVSALILEHTAEARRHLSHAGASHPRAFEVLLLPLERAAKQAIKQRNEASDFINAFQST